MHKKPARIETGEGLQERNKLWWTENQVSYDGRNTSQQAEGTREFYDESEARFFRGWLLFAVATKQPRDAGA